MRFRVVLFLTLLFQFWGVLPARDTLPEQKAIQLFHNAEAGYYADAPTPESDSLAVQHYLAAAKIFSDLGLYSNQVYEGYLNAGIIEQTYERQAVALSYYRMSSRTVSDRGLPDSLLFKPYLFSGNAHYFLNHFDSAIYYFEQAEEILNQYHNLEDAERLYNSLGAIYFQSGNFSQSMNYFQRALQLIAEKDPGMSAGYFSFQSNMASALRRLEYYDSAAIIYRKLLETEIQSEVIAINIASVFLELGQADSAIHYLSKIEDPEEANPVIYYNHLGNAWLLKGETVKAREYLSGALDYGRKLGTGIKSIELGKTFRLLGRIAHLSGSFPEALRYYQQSMVAFEYEFNDTSVFANPVRFEQGFTSYELFESLTAKATCWKDWYLASGDTTHFAHAIETFTCTYRLSDFIRSSFDNEEARLFIGKKVLASYQEGITLALDQFSATKNPKHLQTAFLWASKSKARALSILMRENEIKQFAGLPDTLLHLERDLKLQLSNLLLEKKQMTDMAGLEVLQEEINKCQFELSRVADRLNEFPAYYRLKHELDTLDLAGLQQWLSANDQVLVSYFHTPATLYVFGITGKQLLLHQLPNDSGYQQQVNRLISALYKVNPGEKYSGSAHAGWLYLNLLQPVLETSSARSLIIVPHEALNHIPFEILEDDEQQYLSEKYQVSYQYSSFFVNPSEAGDRYDVNRSIAVAPFADDSHRKVTTQYRSLPSSALELQNISGTILLNQNATRQNFLDNFGEAGIIHLATHSIADYNDPLQSFIAFFPESGTENADKLFAHEIYNLNFQGKELVVLSSCETGSGKSAKGEGILSLSRAFAAAGCDNQVISLWKAEDIPTAYICQHFYSYLQNGEAPAAALRLAKLDLLRDDSMAQYHAPPFWANLIFTGMSAPSSWTDEGLSYMLILVILLIAMIVFTFRRRVFRL